jgi:hypothetical protein
MFTGSPAAITFILLLAGSAAIPSTATVLTPSAITAENPHGHAASPVVAGDPKTAAAFDRLRTLVGTWDMTSTLPSGKTYKDKVIYRLASGGSVLFEEIGPAASMLTTYHLDNGKLVLTHFCTVGNQPRMRLHSITDDGRRLAFEIYDITNLTSPEKYHSTNLEVSFISQDRVQLLYTGKSSAGEQKTVFDLNRTLG